MATLWALGLAFLSFAGLACSAADRCEDVKRRARDLMAEFSACDADRGCQVVDLSTLVPNACLGELQCLAALSAGADLDELSRRARELEREFSDCGECATADCESPEGRTASCDPAARRCRLVE